MNEFATKITRELKSTPSHGIESEKLGLIRRTREEIEGFCKSGHASVSLLQQSLSEKRTDEATGHWQIAMKYYSMANDHYGDLVTQTMDIGSDEAGAAEGERAASEKQIKKLKEAIDALKF